MANTDTMSDTDWAMMLRLAIEKNERERLAEQSASRAGYDPGMTHTQGFSSTPRYVQDRIDAGWPVLDAYEVPEPSLDEKIGQIVGSWFEDRTATEGLSMLPIPGISDAAGLKADAEYFAAHPDEVTPGNVALSAAGVLPFFPGMTAMKNKKLSIKHLDDGRDFVSHVKDLAKEHGTVYVRWSPSSSLDLSGNRVSRDFVSGETHSGLSAVDINSGDDDIDIASKIREYGFLRMQDSRSRPHIYAANVVGRDSDGYPSIIPTKVLATASNDVIKAIDGKFDDVMYLQWNIADMEEKLPRLNGYAAEIIEKSILDARTKLKELVE